MNLHRIDVNFVIKVADFGLSETINPAKDYLRLDNTEGYEVTSEVASSRVFHWLGFLREIWRGMYESDNSSFGHFTVAFIERVFFINAEIRTFSKSDIDLLTL